MGRDGEEREEPAEGQRPRWISVSTCVFTRVFVWTVFILEDIGFGKTYGNVHFWERGVPWIWEIQHPTILRGLPTNWLDTSQASKARHCTVNQLLTNNYYDTPWELSDQRQSSNNCCEITKYWGVLVLLFITGFNCLSSNSLMLLFLSLRTSVFYIEHSSTNTVVKKKIKRNKMFIFFFCTIEYILNLSSAYPRV